jgi:AcrR family transcriptional regulator
VSGEQRTEADLVREFKEALAEFFRRVMPAFAAESTWREQIRGVAYTVFDFVHEDRERARLMLVDTLAAGEQATVMREQGLELLVELIDQGRNELEDPDSVSRATAEAIAGTVHRQIRVAVQSDRVVPELVPKLLYNVVLPYCGAEAAKEELTRPRPSGTGLSSGY